MTIPGAAGAGSTGGGMGIDEEHLKEILKTLNMFGPNVEKLTKLFKLAAGAGAGMGGDSGNPSKDLHSIVQLIKESTREDRKRDKMEVDANRSRLVMMNIMKRAELRELSKQGMPNIAGLMAGHGGGSITGHLGRFQKAIEKPFGQAYNYQKQEDAYKKKWGSFGQGWAAMPSEKDMTKEQKEEKQLLDVEKKKSMQSLLGKKMGGMVNKVGKFMESGAGQGAMGAGMMGASILTMIIKKAIQASPMMQAMLKIMNTAIMLYLRPIGDFIGGMLRPIALFFMREIAIPALRAGKGMMSMGEQLGKALLGFMLKPIESIQQAIVKSLSQFPLIAGVMGGQAEHWENYDPIKDWMLDRKMDTMINILDEELDLEKKGIKLSREHIVHAMKGNKFMAGGMGGVTNIQESSEIREEIRKFIDEFQKDDDLMSKYGYNTGGMMADYNMIKAGKLENVYEQLDANIKALTTTNTDGTAKIVTAVSNAATLIAQAVAGDTTTAAADAAKVLEEESKKIVEGGLSVGAWKKAEDYFAMQDTGIRSKAGTAYNYEAWKKAEGRADTGTGGFDGRADRINKVLNKAEYEKFMREQQLWREGELATKRGGFSAGGSWDLGQSGYFGTKEFARMYESTTGFKAQGKGGVLSEAQQDAEKMRWLMNQQKQGETGIYEQIKKQGMTPQQFLAGTTAYAAIEKYTKTVEEAAAADAAATDGTKELTDELETTEDKVFDLGEAAKHAAEFLENIFSIPEAAAFEGQIMNENTIPFWDWDEILREWFPDPNVNPVDTYTQKQKDAWNAASGYFGDVGGATGDLRFDPNTAWGKAIMESNPTGINSVGQTTSWGAIAGTNISGWGAVNSGVGTVGNTGFGGTSIGGSTKSFSGTGASALARANASPSKVSGGFGRSGLGLASGTSTKLQHGGWITEPIFGWGASGTNYTLGEAGPELVTPAGQVGGIVANISINIDKIAHDIDLEQIKPIVERALLEVHARRGII